jgi:PAS domain S-box-containing protein
MEMENEIDDLLDVQKIINQNSDKSVMVLDSWNKIVFVNPVFEKMTGFSLQEI